jgi:hypothetical protein
MSNPILIVHGWSDNYESFVPLRQWLAKRFAPAQQVFFGNYDSMENHVRFDDLAVGLQTRFNEMKAKGTLTLAPFSVDVIVHSTGGPVIRHWLNYYLKHECGDDRSKCPIRKLIMLAPANFGSRLAAEGKSALAKLFKGGVAHGFETGDLILDGLELGSPELWGMAQDDLFSGQSIYPCAADRGPFVFVFSGTDTYGKLKGFVAPGANEDGSDGTIRASASSLNSILLRVNCQDPRHPRPTIKRPANQPVAFGLVPGKNHTGIVPRRDDDPDAHPTCKLITRCMAVNSDADYNKLRGELDGETAAFYGRQGKDGVNQYQQFVVHVCDELGKDVPDYRLDFHAVDSSEAVNTWVGSDDLPEGLKKYADYTRTFQKEVVANVEMHSVNTSYRTFYINIDRLKELRAKMEDDTGKPYIAVNLDATGPTPDLGYDTDRLVYLPVTRPISDGQGGKAEFFLANTTTLVEFQLLGVPTAKVMNVFDAATLAGKGQPNAGSAQPPTDDNSQGQGGGD